MNVGPVKVLHAVKIIVQNEKVDKVLDSTVMLGGGKKIRKSLATIKKASF